MAAGGTKPGPLITATTDITLQNIRCEIPGLQNIRCEMPGLQKVLTGKTPLLGYFLKQCGAMIDPWWTSYFDCMIMTH